MKIELEDYVIGKGWITGEPVVGVVTSFYVPLGSKFDVEVDQIKGIVEPRKISKEQYEAIKNLLRR